MCANQPKVTWYAIGASWNRQEMARVCPRPTAWWNGWTKVPACSQAHGNRGWGGRRQSGLHCFVGTVHFSPSRPRTPLRKDTIWSRMKSSCHTGVHCSFHTKMEDLFVNSFKQIENANARGSIIILNLSWNHHIQNHPLMRYHGIGIYVCCLAALVEGCAGRGLLGY